MRVLSTSISCIFFYHTLLFHVVFFFFFNDTATTEIYTLSLHDALPILFVESDQRTAAVIARNIETLGLSGAALRRGVRSEEHTSELQSHLNLVCRLLLEKKKNYIPHLETRPHSSHFLTFPTPFSRRDLH